MNKRALLLFVAFLSLLLCCACSKPLTAAPEAGTTEPPAAVPTAVPTATPAPTASPTPTATPVPTPYTIVWMSDTQMYASTYPDIYRSMMQYVTDQMAEQNFVCLLHTGDLINNAFSDHDPANATSAFNLLPDTLPVLTVCGNHDISRNKNQWGYLDFDYSPYLSFDFDTDCEPDHWMDDGISHYMLFSAGGTDFLFLSIGYGVEKASVSWANAVIAEYPDRIVVLCTHSYLQPTWKLSGPGKVLYEGVVVPNENVRLVLCGHLRGAQRYVREIEDDNDGDGKPDRVINEVLFNYQDEPEGGHGYLRLLTVDPLTGDVHVSTYSPWLDDYDYRAAKDTFDLPGIFRPIK